MSALGRKTTNSIASTTRIVLFAIGSECVGASTRPGVANCASCRGVERGRGVAIGGADARRQSCVLRPARQVACAGGRHRFIAVAEEPGGLGIGLRPESELVGHGVVLGLLEGQPGRCADLTLVGLVEPGHAGGDLLKVGVLAGFGEDSPDDAAILVRLAVGDRDVLVLDQVGQGGLCSGAVGLSQLGGVNAIEPDAVFGTA